MSERVPLSRRLRRAGLWVAGIGLIGVVAQWPVTTRYGINYQVEERQMTLAEKAIQFLSRDLQARRLADEVTRGAATDDEKLLRIFSWVTAHVRRVPDGFPIVDDHVLHTIIRGYGAPDQRTEAFTLLASYAGFPAGQARLRIPGAPARITVALVRHGARTLLFDVERGFAFLDAQGAFAGVEELKRDPGLVSAVAGGATVNGVPYERYVAHADLRQIRFERMEDQHPWLRMRNEILHWLGW